MMRRAATIAVVVAALAACGGGDESDGPESSDVASSDTSPTPISEQTAPEPTATPDDTDPPPTSTSVTDAPTTDSATIPPTTDSATIPPTTIPPTTIPPTTTPPTTTALLPGFDDLIALGVEPGTVTDRPLLRWDPVDGADHYGVYVYAPSGEIYWAWRGRDTSVPLGGDIGDAPGPAVADGMSWAVIAYDGDLLPVTVSAVVALLPAS